MTNKFNVGDKAVLNCDYSDDFTKGTEVIVISAVNRSNSSHSIIGIKKANGVTGSCFAYRLDLIESKRTKNQRITALEETVAKQGEEINELKLIVAQIRKPSTVVQEAIDKAKWQRGEVEGVIKFEGKQYKKVDREAREGDVVVINRTSTPEWLTVGKPYKTYECPMDGTLGFKGKKGAVTVYGGYQSKHTIHDVDVYELIVEDKPFPPFIFPKPPKTANQLRAEIIEKAKGFVEKNSISKDDAKTNKYVSVRCWKTYIEFVVNTEKNTIVALAKGLSTHHVISRGIAKCMPGDVFNVWIGKAIALGRALGLDVSEFEQAVQPTEFVVGQYVQCLYPNEVHVEGELVGVESQKTLNFKGEDYKKYLNHAYKRTSLGGNLTATIINDTNAQYEVNK